MKKFLSLKIVGTNSWPEFCYLLNAFQNPARESASC